MSHLQVILVQYLNGKVNGLARYARWTAGDKALEITSTKFGLGCTKYSAAHHVKYLHIISSFLLSNAQAFPLLMLVFRGKVFLPVIASPVLLVVLTCK